MTSVGVYSNLATSFGDLRLCLRKELLIVGNMKVPAPVDKSQQILLRDGSMFQSKVTCCSLSAGIKDFHTALENMTNTEINLGQYTRTQVSFVRSIKVRTLRSERIYITI